VGIDVGCGTGGFLAAVRGNGRRWIGLDYSKEALAYCRMRGLQSLVQGSAAALPFPGGEADVVVCLDVLYHRAVQDDRLVLAECARVLRPSGTAIITDSALNWLRGPHDEAVHTRKRYRLGELAGLVESSGLRLIRRTYTNCLLLPGLAAIRIGRRLFPTGGQLRSDTLTLPPMLEWGLAKVMAVERRLLRWTDLPIGSSILLVAQKS
jgi:SAM-dependent methyltransferase